MKKKKKEIPVLSNKIVQLVLNGDDNQTIIKKLGLKGSKNRVNCNINAPREWFNAHERETGYAKKFLSLFKTEDIQSRFVNLCSMPKGIQIKDMLLEAELNKRKKAKAYGRRPLALAQ